MPMITLWNQYTHNTAERFQCSLIARKIVKKLESNRNQSEVSANALLFMGDSIGMLTSLPLTGKWGQAPVSYRKKVSGTFFQPMATVKRRLEHFRL